ncbi:uncharacterized protein BKA78DRAFT_320072 [Phyllosticta capitalensis]|uniref:uncharacterized protein n=1 Tax=Phyllosticta capitalensis TaxID=121624 RepID=UPI00313147D6
MGERNLIHRLGRPQVRRLQIRPHPQCLHLHRRRMYLPPLPLSSPRQTPTSQT